MCKSIDKFVENRVNSFYIRGLELSSTFLCPTCETRSLLCFGGGSVRSSSFSDKLPPAPLAKPPLLMDVPPALAAASAAAAAAAAILTLRDGDPTLSCVVRYEYNTYHVCNLFNTNTTIRTVRIAMHLKGAPLGKNYLKPGFFNTALRKILKKK